MTLLPQRKSPSPVSSDLRLSIYVSDNKTVTCQSFPTPEAYDAEMKNRKENKKKVNGYLREIEIILLKIDEPEESFETEYLWETLFHITARAHKDQVFNQIKESAIAAAKRLAQR